MPAAKYTFLTRVDELALSEALHAKFPEIRFYSTEPKNPGRHYRYFDDIASADVREVHMCVGPHMVVPAKFGGVWGNRIFNVSDEVMVLTRSPGVLYKYQRPDMDHGTFQIGITSVMTKPQTQLMNQVWRILAKIGTYRWMRRNEDGSLGEYIDKRWFAGNDAVRWALECKERRLCGMKPAPPAES
jgi:hypothetical protein